MYLLRFERITSSFFLEDLLECLLGQSHLPQADSTYPTIRLLSIQKTADLPVKSVHKWTRASAASSGKWEQWKSLTSAPEREG